MYHVCFFNVSLYPANSKVSKENLVSVTTLRCPFFAEFSRHYDLSGRTQRVLPCRTHNLSRLQPHFVSLCQDLHYFIFLYKNLLIFHRRYLSVFMSSISVIKLHTSYRRQEIHQNFPWNTHLRRRRLFRFQWTSYV